MLVKCKGSPGTPVKDVPGLDKRGLGGFGEAWKASSSLKFRRK
jgi:hypothetical protein